VGHWTWELSEFPAAWRGSFAYLDEVWVPSTFTLDAVAAAAPVPVLRMPYSIAERSVDGVAARRRLGWPEGECVFLFVFDFASFTERKNPLGLVRAFTSAFRPGEPARLVLKAMHPGADPTGAAALTDAARAPRIHLATDVVDRDALTELMAAADCYVSLHRAEGFGLTLAEAMALGIPTIATGYSGNLDFMRADNSVLVRYALRPLERDHGPYRRGMVWAEPDVDHAAACLRWVYEHRDEARALGARGRDDVRATLGPAAVGARVRERLALLADDG
jgi:glycosyltransferase involved in cell wall biosynthesis